VQRIRTFAACDSGVTLVEYGIALILAITLGTAALTDLGTAVDTQITDAENIF